MRSTIIITRLYLQCPKCQKLVPDGEFDSFYEICIDCTNNLLATKEVTIIEKTIS